MASNKLLSGYKVVELANYIAGPTSARILADWGAEVIKVEPLAGDVWRYYGVNVNCPITEAENPMFDLYNANKKGVALNLKSPEGMEIFHKLLAQADVFVTNNRAGALRKMGLDYDSLKDKYPKLIFAALTGYGEEGPDKDLPGFDSVAYWARSGFLVDMANPKGYPVTAPGGFGDSSTGTALFGGICAALLAREKTGKGDRVEVSLFGTAVWYNSVQAVITQEQYNDPYPKDRLENNPFICPYKCSDGEWILISLLEYDRYFRPFCEALEIPEVADDPRFNNNLDCLKNRAELIPILEAAFVKFDSVTLTEKLKAIDLVFDRLRHFKELCQDRQALENDYMRVVKFDSGNEAAMPVPPAKSRNLGRPDYKRGPHLGEHTDEVLASLGYNAEAIAAFKQQNIIK